MRCSFPLTEGITQIFWNDIYNNHNARANALLVMIMSIKTMYFLENQKKDIMLPFYQLVL